MAPASFLNIVPVYLSLSLSFVPAFAALSMSIASWSANIAVCVCFCSFCCLSILDSERCSSDTLHSECTTHPFPAQIQASLISSGTRYTWTHDFCTERSFRHTGKASKAHALWPSRQVRSLSILVLTLALSSSVAIVLPCARHSLDGGSGGLFCASNYLMFLVSVCSIEIL